ncbi:carbamoyltransferase HypF [Desulfosediminicola ganghwensis]|uniref:carbamoyltransferase HypF n=1 Tax=Desulfosediminicola ganghwensis TaxID=2569540 RepID=UPI00142F1FB7|nr:carbamoyltransferase HypF [Desulfosediminicola ganghwensis]
MTSSYTNKQEHKGLEILIRGTVQGVGFRPFVYNLASRLGIHGTVSNTSDGVHIRAYANDDGLFSFLEGLKTEAPPLARITSIDEKPLVEPIDPAHEDSFTILASVAGDSAKTAIPPDIAICDDCIRELLTPGDHRFHYPFINCTNCGPRLTIVESIPYDRPKTSMKVFPMCPVCLEQYQDPTDRRFHAQPNACAHCGPELFWHAKDGTRRICDSPLAEAATALSHDMVVAMRGLGGFHLVVNGHSQLAVAKLRERKNRPHKPLAVMMPDLETVRKYCVVDDKEQDLLTSGARPIVLLKKRDSFSLPSDLAPEMNELGVMLPYTPFQYLLFQQKECPDVLVMTSGNASGAPICTANDDALKRLAPISDRFLLHNRDIVTRVDDSVARVTNHRPQIYRRARGYVPTPLDIPWKLPAGIGCGGGLKSTFALSEEKTVYLSQHIGDLFNLESFDFYSESVEHLKKVFQIEPEIVVCDLHPDYMSSHYGAELSKKKDLPLYQVQHHHAHAVAVMAEHGLEGQTLAVVLDGTGYGPDNTIWGGEILLADLTGYQRLAHLQYLHQPGGDAAAHEPWRMGLSALFQMRGGEPCAPNELPKGLHPIPSGQVKIINTMLEKDFNTPTTSSCGRLFDAMAAILGVRHTISYEGQAAIELEALARTAATNTWYHQIPDFQRLAGNPPLCKKGEKWEICSSEFVTLALQAQAQGLSRAGIALQFHLQLISCICELVERLSVTTAVRNVVLAGGCMQNSLLLEGLQRKLTAKKFAVFTGENVPINDGGISLGQIITGGLQHVSRNTHEGCQG